MTEATSIWGGRFAADSSAIMQEINQSISFDIRLAKYDILLSQAHCKMLAKTGIITQAEADQILEGLAKISQQIAAGTFETNIKLEDIHMNIEATLTKIIGEVAGKLHTARSRNDQVATDLKLWVRDALDEFAAGLQKLQAVLLKQAKQHTDTIMPGFTHLQSAQPSNFWSSFIGLCGNV